MNTPVSFRCLKAEWIALLNQEFQFRGSPSYSRYISHPMSSKLRYNDRRIICQFVIYKFSLPRFISRTHLLKRSGRVFSLLRDVISFWIPCFHRLHEISHSHHPWHQKKTKNKWSQTWIYLNYFSIAHSFPLLSFLFGSVVGILRLGR